MMDRKLTTPRERTAADMLKQILDIIEDYVGGWQGMEARDKIYELCELYTHEVVEAAAEKGRGQIQ